MALNVKYLFGENFKQDNQFIRFNKADYPEFSKYRNPSAQKILSILIKRWMRLFFGVLEQGATPITDNRNNAITFNHAWVGDVYVSFTRNSIKYDDDEKYFYYHVKISFHEIES